MNSINPAKRTRFQSVLLIAGIIFVSLNLRPALAVVGPLISSIRAATGLSNTMLGFLTTLPLLAFGFISIFTPFFTKKVGMEVTLAGALGLIIMGSVARVIPINIALFGGTLIVGIGIAFGNVLLPSLIKRDFPNKAGILTSVYSGTLTLSSSISAGLSVPVSQNIGWQWTLAACAIPAVIALFIWMPQLKHQTRPKNKRSLRQSLKHLSSKMVAWQVAVYMGLQSFTFYVMLAWLPEILQTQGISPINAGWLLSLSQGMGFFGGVIIPIWAEKLSSQRRPVILLFIIEGISLVGLLLSSSPFIALWVALLGFALGANFGLSLLLIVLRTNDSDTAAELSGMVQSIGYLLAATGPTLFGLLHDITHVWSIPLISLLGILTVKAIAGYGAARPIEID